MEEWPFSSSVLPGTLQPVPDFSSDLQELLVSMPCCVPQWNFIWPVAITSFYWETALGDSCFWEACWEHLTLSDSCGIHRAFSLPATVVTFSSGDTELCDCAAIGSMEPQWWPTSNMYTGLWGCFWPSTVLALVSFSILVFLFTSFFLSINYFYNLKYHFKIYPVLSTSLYELPELVLGFTLCRKQWFLNSSVHLNHLEALLKPKWLPFCRRLWFGKSGWGLRLCISNTLPRVVDATGLGITFLSTLS